MYAHLSHLWCVNRLKHKHTSQLGSKPCLISFSVSFCVFCVYFNLNRQISVFRSFQIQINKLQKCKFLSGVGKNTFFFFCRDSPKIRPFVDLWLLPQRQHSCPGNPSMFTASKHFRHFRDTARQGHGKKAFFSQTPKFSANDAKTTTWR